MHVLIVGGSRADRLRAAVTAEESRRFRPSSRLALDPAVWPFSRFAPGDLPIATPRLIRIDDFERACPNQQVSGTRLILTQPTYTLQVLADALGPEDRLLLTADRERLEQEAPEAMLHRGPWRLFTVIDITAKHGSTADSSGAQGLTPEDEVGSVEARLSAAFHMNSAEHRLTACREILHANPRSAAAALSLASACRETEAPIDARAALDSALRLAADWAAVHYEDGKFWLGADEAERARDAFGEAARLMPSFSSALSNLGAVLGELDCPDEAVTAFSQALEFDPESVTIWNNIGVVQRERGRLEDSERALLRVVELAPGFVFGHYNLGHTRFLRGDYAGALAAYEQGQHRDPEKNRRQGVRLAMMRFANGDFEGTERELWRHADAAPADEREDLLLEAYEIGGALLQAHPGLAAGRAVVERIAGAITH